VNTVSIGAVSYRACRPTAPEELVEQSDRLLYLTKQSGRDQVRTNDPRATSQP
jgi:PleD family two-component response regulator